jgi:hypothetical protein
LEDLKAKNITLLDALVVAIVCVMIQKVFRWGSQQPMHQEEW